MYTEDQLLPHSCKNNLVIYGSLQVFCIVFGFMLDEMLKLMRIVDLVKRICLIGVVGGTLLACSRYEDGPLISFRSPEKRLENTWNAELVSRNNIDETNRYDLYQMQFGSSNQFNWMFQLEADTTEQIWEGEWAFLGNEDRLRLSFMDPTDTLDNQFILDAEILRLKKDELWIRYLQEGDQFYIRMKP